MGSQSDSDKTKLFKTQIGQAATVQRENVSVEKAAIPNRKLIDLGLELNPVPNAMEYRGSAAVHIFVAPTIQEVAFISQTHALDLYRCPEVVASKAFDDLLRTMKLMYGHRVGRLRSGF